MNAKILVTIVAAMMFSACSAVDAVYGPHRTPHEEFIAMFDYWAGKSMQSFCRNGFCKELAKQMALPNGNIENQYDYHLFKRPGICKVFIEYNPQTNIINGWRFEGKETDCIWQG